MEEEVLQLVITDAETGSILQPAADVVEEEVSVVENAVAAVGQEFVSQTKNIVNIIEDFLKEQGRFKHLFKPGNEDLIVQFQAEVDRRWEDLQYKCAR